MISSRRVIPEGAAPWGSRLPGQAVPDRAADSPSSVSDGAADGTEEVAYAVAAIDRVELCIRQLAGSPIILVHVLHRSLLPFQIGRTIPPSRWGPSPIRTMDAAT